jgi:phosphate transport system permease protein
MEGPSDPEGTIADAPTRPRERARLLRFFSRAFEGTASSFAVLVLVFAVGLSVLLGGEALPSIQRFGLGFLTSSQWDLARNRFGAAPAVVGTLLTSALALLFAVPVALGVALFSSEFAPRWLRTPLSYFVDLGAAIPSIVYGFWALVVLKPVMESTVEPGLSHTTGGRLLFSGLPIGLDLLTASVILGIMVIPTISAFSREALHSVSGQQREAALSLGATRWEATRMVVLGPALPGLAGAVVLGLGRAIGETIAVALVVGGGSALPTSLFSQGETIPSALANGLTDSFGLQLSALYELCLVLLAISVAVNLGARLLLRKYDPSRSTGGARTSPHRTRAPTVGPPSTAGPGAVELLPFWPNVMARQAARRFRRRLVYALVVALVVGAVIIAAYPLASLVKTAVVNGGGAVVRPSFYTAEPPAACGVNQSSCPIGGIGPAIEGTFVLLALASMVGLPVGLLTGIYLAEYRRARLRRAVGLAVDVLVGVPSILIGAFVFALFLRFDELDARTALAGGAALGLLMTPIVARATETALGTVPGAVRDSALALGFPRHRVTTRVVIGSCRSALVTGSLLAIMRAGGEAAAVIVTAGSSQYWLPGLRSPTAALAPFIYYALTSNASPNLTTDAWGAALVLLLIMAAISLAARLALRTESQPAPE